jgi:hypothetical protein
VREEDGLAAQLPKPYVIDIAELRLEIASEHPKDWATFSSTSPSPQRSSVVNDTVEIHGKKCKSECILNAVERCRECSWRWGKTA